jgi:hypothetical protein
VVVPLLVLDVLVPLVPVMPLPVPVEPLVPIEPVPLVPVMPVPDVSVPDIPVPVIPVPDVSVLIVPVVPVEDIAVSVVDIVDDESVEAESVVEFVFSVLLQATRPNSATTARARKIASDFFMCVSLLKSVVVIRVVVPGEITLSAYLTSFACIRHSDIPGENRSARFREIARRP